MFPYLLQDQEYQYYRYYYMFTYLPVTIGSGVLVLKVLLLYVPISIRHIRISTKGIVIELFILLFNLH